MMVYPAVKTLLLTSLALLAFAGNSVLCRLALKAQLIDPASFTAIRLVAGALTLMFLYLLRSRIYQGFSISTINVEKTKAFLSTSRLIQSLALFIYAAGFSFAYRSLETGTGALILFGVVQLTLLFASLLKGDRPGIAEWCGILLAFFGLFILIQPVLTSPSLVDFLLMSAAGIAWGVYTIGGRYSRDALYDSACNFLFSVPLLLLFIPLILFDNTAMHISWQGIVLALLSGGITSGLGYALWYTALPMLSSTRAAVVQLSVPLLAALGGTLFLLEPLTLRFIIAASVTLGGIFWVIYGAGQQKPISR